MTQSPEEQMAVEEWTQAGAFTGTDGRPVRCYDDVILSRAIPVSGGVRTDIAHVPEGTTATVLFYSLGPVGVAQLECDVGEDAFAFGYEELSRLKLYMTNEEKYASINNLSVAVDSREGSVG